MDSKLNRRDVGYTVLSRFEEVLRALIIDRIEAQGLDTTQAVPKGIVEKACERSANSNNDLIDLFDNFDFPDLKEIINYQKRFKAFLPNADYSKEEFDRGMDRLYQLRCKIAHIRGYFTSIDLDALLENCQVLSQGFGLLGSEFKEFLTNLNERPETLVVSVPLGFFNGAFDLATVPNNLPTPDFEFEGGFIGREEDIKKVTLLLESNLHRVVTLSGAGGVGKTALALRVLQKLFQKNSHGFDGCVWLSAKETKLSVLGIEPMEPTFRNYEQLLDTILDVMGQKSDQVVDLLQKETDVSAIFDLYNRVLVVIDNLETVSDQRIINFVLDAPPKSKILITSRRGLGQVERRHELSQLKEREAIALFRQIAKDKNLQKLAALADGSIQRYVKKVACYPLAIKWLIGLAALGKDINLVVQNISESSSDISKFCFEAIYSSLTEGAKAILCALSFFEDPPSGGVLKYVVDQGQQDFEDSVQELILVSLVLPEQTQENSSEVTTRYGLLSLTRGYVRGRLDKDSFLKRNLETRHQTVHAVTDEAERAKKRYRHDLADLGASSEEEKVAALLAQTAYQRYENSDYEEAVAAFRKACDIAPRFASVYRNWAVIESKEGHSLEADRLMEKAAQLKPEDSRIWMAWGNIKRKDERIQDALVCYEKAYELSPKDPAIMNALGQAKSRLGDYEDAIKLFESALSDELQPHSPKHKIISHTNIAECNKNWSQAMVRDRNYANAEQKLVEALQHCETAIAIDKTDEGSFRTQRLIFMSLASFYKLSDPDKALEYFKQCITARPIHASEQRSNALANFNIADVYYSKGDLQKAREYCPRDLGDKIARFAPKF